MKAHKKTNSTAPVWLLFFLAPFIGEWLLGNQRFSDLYKLPLLGLLYGCGAILIREITRRTKRGYPTMIALGTAYALMEEGIVDQLFFNPDYFTGQRELSVTVLPFMGIDVWLLLILLAMHTIWSTFIPIVLTEMIFSKRGRQPWLSNTGLKTVIALLVTGCVLLTYLNYDRTKFLAPALQYIILFIITTAIVVITFRTRQLSLPLLPVPLPRHPWIAGLATLVITGLYLDTGIWPGWIRVLCCLLLAGFSILLFYSWSQKNWSTLYTLAAVSGCLITYSWQSIGMVPETGPKSFTDYIGTALFIILSFCLLFLARKNITATNEPIG